MLVIVRFDIFVHFREGWILNRFTNDLSMMDEQLPRNLFHFSEVNVHCVDRL